MPDQVPAITRNVHYVAYGTPGGEYPQACRAAIITDVGAWEQLEVLDETEPDEDMGRTRTVRQLWVADRVSLSVFNPTGIFLNQQVPYDAGLDLGPNSTQVALCDGRAHAGGTWHWPARV